MASAAILQLIMKNFPLSIFVLHLYRLYCYDKYRLHLYRQALNLYKSFAFWLTYRISARFAQACSQCNVKHSWDHNSLNISVKIKLYCLIWILVWQNWKNITADIAKGQILFSLLQHLSSEVSRKSFPISSIQWMAHFKIWTGISDHQFHFALESSGHLLNCLRVVWENAFFPYTCRRMDKKSLPEKIILISVRLFRVWQHRCCDLDKNVISVRAVKADSNWNLKKKKKLKSGIRPVCKARAHRSHTKKEAARTAHLQSVLFNIYAINCKDESCLF